MKREVVEVTTYPLLAEVFGGRGLWDSARIITVLLAAFSLASWGLELSMDLSSLEGEADLLNRPPPVFLRPETNDTNTDPWQASYVRQYGFLWKAGGFLWFRDVLWIDDSVQSSVFWLVGLPLCLLDGINDDVWRWYL